MPFLDGALGGIGAGFAGATAAFTIYVTRHAGHPGVGGCVIGPLCGIWMCLAVFMAEPKVTRSDTDEAV